MGFLALSTVFCLCFASSLATYGPEHKHHGPRAHGGYKEKLEEPRIHLDSPKIILNKPSINVQGSDHGHGILEDEPIILANQNPLYIRKTLHGIPAASAVHSAPLILDAHPGYGHGYSAGRVLDISAPIQVINHAPIVHERPILIRRPVVVSKGLTTTQDHLERLHYAHSTAYGGHGGHGGHGDYAIPVSKALHERTVVYGGLGHGLGHGGGLGHGIVSTYSAPLIVEQPKAIIGHADVGYSSGKALGGAVLHGGAAYHGGAHHGVALHGGSLHGGSLHGGALHGVALHGGSLHGGSLHGGSLHGGSLHGGSLHGGSLHGGSLHGGSLHGGSLHGVALHGGSSHGAALKKY